MIETHGLTHISLAVREPQRALDFYAQVFGVREYFRDEDQIQALGPGPNDVLAFVKSPEKAGTRCGIDHFGFRLKRPEDIQLAVEEIRRAGGQILRSGEFSPGFPFLYAADLPGFFGPLISRKMAPYERGAHEKESIHGRTDGCSAA